MNVIMEGWMMFGWIYKFTIELRGTKPIVLLFCFNPQSKGELSLSFQDMKDLTWKLIIYPTHVQTNLIIEQV